MTSPKRESRPLFEEPYGEYCRDKYFFVLAGLLLLIVMSYLLIVSIQCLLLGPSCVGYDIVDLPIFIVGILASYVLLRIGLARKRIRIFEHKIALAFPRKFFPGLEVLWHGDAIEKQDIHEARLEVLSGDNEIFRIQGTGLYYRGNTGDWRVEFVFRDEESRILDWRQFSQKEKGKSLEAMAHFLKDIPKTTLLGQPNLDIDEVLIFAKDVDKKTGERATFGAVVALLLVGICVVMIGGYLAWFALEMCPSPCYAPTEGTVLLASMGAVVVVLGAASIIGAYRELRKIKIRLEQQGKR
jgi:hypothetical protein